MKITVLILSTLFCSVCSFAQEEIVETENTLTAFVNYGCGCGGDKDKTGK